MNDTKAEKNPTEQRQLILAINFLMVGLMLSCFAFVTGKLIHALYPQWSLVLFPILAFLIALESLILRYSQRSPSLLETNPALSLIAEIITIFLTVKIISMVASGTTSLWIEIQTWGQNFLGNFFNTQYLLLLAGVLTIWALSWMFALPLIRLNEDEKLMAQEKLGYTFTDRQEARRNLISLIFSLGLLMIVFSVVMNSNLILLEQSQTSTRSLLVIFLAYFFSAFVFMALNQYTILRSRWYFGDITVNPHLAGRWLFYAIIFILIVTLLVIFLPTNFTVEIYPLAQFLANVLVYLFALLQFAIIVPIAFLMTLLNSLFGNESVGTQEPQPKPEFFQPMPELSLSIPWWEVAKSLTFWIIFLAVIIFSLRYYFQNRKDFLRFFKDIHIGQSIRSFLSWFQEGWIRLKRTAEETVQKGINRFPALKRTKKLRLTSLADIARRVPPRQAVILVYIDWLHWSRSHGLKRKESQTPLEFAYASNHQFPENSEASDALTEIFITARYSGAEIEKTDVHQARELFEKIKKTFIYNQDETLSSN